MRVPSDMPLRSDRPVKEELNEEDLKVIERFVVAIQDQGVQLALEFVALDEFEGRSEALAVVREANRQVTNVCKANSGAWATDFNSKAIVRAAPALLILLNYADQADMFPEDFLPSEDVRQYCINAFFESLRSLATPPNLSDAEHRTP